MGEPKPTNNKNNKNNSNNKNKSNKLNNKNLPNKTKQLRPVTYSQPKPTIWICVWYRRMRTLGKNQFFTFFSRFRVVVSLTGLLRRRNPLPLCEWSTRFERPNVWFFTDSDHGGWNNFHTWANCLEYNNVRYLLRMDDPRTDRGTSLPSTPNAYTQIYARQCKLTPWIREPVREVWKPTFGMGEPPTGV